MISIERAREILGNKNLTHDQVKKIRDDLHAFAEIIFDRWLEEKKKKY